MQISCVITSEGGVECWGYNEPYSVAGLRSGVASIGIGQARRERLECISVVSDYWTKSSMTAFVSAMTSAISTSLEFLCAWCMKDKAVGSQCVLWEMRAV
jgi:hypothetical protein